MNIFHHHFIGLIASKENGADYGSFLKSSFQCLKDKCRSLSLSNMEISTNVVTDF